MGNRSSSSSNFLESWALRFARFCFSQVPTKWACEVTLCILFRASHFHLTRDTLVALGSQIGGKEEINVWKGKEPVERSRVSHLCIIIHRSQSTREKIDELNVCTSQFSALLVNDYCSLTHLPANTIDRIRLWRKVVSVTLWRWWSLCVCLSYGKLAIFRIFKMDSSSSSSGSFCDCARCVVIQFAFFLPRHAVQKMKVRSAKCKIQFN